MRINLDMDGTFVDLYGVDGWLDDLLAERTRPYDEAKPLVNFARLAKAINRAQSRGTEVCIISWLSKDSTEAYDRAVTNAKLNYLRKHLPSVNFNNIYIVPYGTPKQNFCRNANDILIDDEKPNRDNWTGKAYEPSEIFNILA